MTLSGFSEKYGIPLSIVYQSSFHTEARYDANNDGGHIDFPEDQLFTAVRLSLEDKIKAGNKQLETNRMRLARLTTHNGKYGSIEEMCEKLKAVGL